MNNFVLIYNVDKTMVVYGLLIILNFLCWRKIIADSWVIIFMQGVSLEWVGLQVYQSSISHIIVLAASFLGRFELLLLLLLRLEADDDFK